MAGKRNPDHAVAAVIDVLTDDTPAKFDAIDTEMNDSITLRDVARWYEAPLHDYDVLPAGVVVCDETQYPADLASEDIMVHILQVQVFELQEDVVGTLLPQEVLARKLGRMVRGIVEALDADPRLLSDAGAARVDYVTVTGVQYSDFAPDARGGFVRGAKLDLAVQVST